MDKLSPPLPLDKASLSWDNSSRQDLSQPPQNGIFAPRLVRSPDNHAPRRINERQ